MGIYMSAYIEVDYSTSAPPFTDAEQVFSLTEGSFILDRRYEVFDAFVFGWSVKLPAEDRDPLGQPPFAPRGMPSPCSLSVSQDYFRLVASPPAMPNHHFWPAHLCVSPAVADQWARDRGSHESEVRQSFNVGQDGKWAWRVVSVPEHYNASWLRPDELDAALKHHGLELATLPVEYRILRVTMAELAAQFGDDRVRLVVWFS